MTSSHLDKRALEVQKRELSLQEDRIKRREQRNEEQDKKLSQRKKDLDKKESLFREHESDLRQKNNEIDILKKKTVQKNESLDTLFDEQSKQKNIFLFISFLLLIGCTILGYFSWSFYQDTSSKRLLLAKAEKAQMMLETSVEILEKEKNVLGEQLSQARNESFRQDDQIKKIEKELQQANSAKNVLVTKVKVVEGEVANRMEENQRLKEQVEKLRSGLAKSVENSASVDRVKEKLEDENKGLGLELLALNKKIEELYSGRKEQSEELKKSAGIIVNSEQLLRELTRKLDLEIAASQKVNEELAIVLNDNELLAESFERSQLESAELAKNNQQLSDSLAQSNRVNRELGDKVQVLKDRLNSIPVVDSGQGATEATVVE